MARGNSNAVVAIIARLGSIGMSFVLAVVIARLLPADEAGAFFLASILVTIAATVGRFGIDTFALKRIGANHDISRDIGPGLLLVLAASLIAGTAIAITFAVIFRQFESPFWWSWILVAVAVPAQALGVIAGSILRAHGRLGAGVVAELGAVPTLTTLVVLGTALWITPTLSSALLALSVASIVTAVGSLALASRSIATAPRVNDSLESENTPRRGFVRSHFASLATIMTAAVLVFAVTWAPVLVLSAEGLLAQVTYFTIAARVANLVGLIPAVQVSYLAPRFAELIHRGELAELNAIAKRNARLSLAVAALPVAIIAIWTQPLLEFAFGTDSHDAVAATRILLIAVTVSMAGGQIPQLLVLCGLERVAMAIQFVSLGAWLVFAAALTTSMSSSVAALATTVITTAATLAGAITLRRFRAIHSTA